MDKKALIILMIVLIFATLVAAGILYHQPKNDFIWPTTTGEYLRYKRNNEHDIYNISREVKE